MANFPTNSKMPNIDMTPMVDLGFLLIISFILTTIFAKPKTIEMIEPHGCGSMDSYSEGCIRNGRIVTLVLTETDKVKLYTNPDDINNSFDSFDLSKNGLRSFIIEKKKAITEAFGNEMPLTFLIKATRNAKYKTLIDVIDEMKIANASFALRRMEAIDSVALGLH